MSIVNVDTKRLKTLEMFHLPHLAVSADGEVYNTVTKNFLKPVKSTQIRARNLYDKCRYSAPLFHAVAMVWKDEPVQYWKNSTYADCIMRYHQFDIDLANDFIRPTQHYGVSGFPYYISRSGTVYNGEYRSILEYYSHKGYYYVILNVVQANKHFRKLEYIHRLIAKIFIPIPDRYKNVPLQQLQVNHIDSDTTNNSIENLEWCNHFENIRHACLNGTAERFKIARDKVVQVLELLKQNKSLKEISRITGIDIACVSRILRQENSIANDFAKKMNIRFPDSYKDRLIKRNRTIRSLFLSGKSIERLTKKFHVSRATIKRAINRQFVHC